MRQTFLFLCLVAVFAMTLPACSSTKEMAQTSGHSCEGCAQGASGKADVWCDGCSHGYVAGARVDCKACYTGKTGTDTWCEDCGVGYLSAQKVSCNHCYRAGSATCNCGG